MAGFVRLYLRSSPYVRDDPYESCRFKSIAGEPNLVIAVQ
jgi:hypothetical protein